MFGQVTSLYCPPCSVSVVMVVGAGRGPLVGAALKAASSTRRMVKVYAIEKNPGAVITLVPPVDIYRHCFVHLLQCPLSMVS